MEFCSFSQPQRAVSAPQNSLSSSGSTAALSCQNSFLRAAGQRLIPSQKPFCFMELHLWRTLELPGEQDNLSPAPYITLSNQEAARQLQIFLLRPWKEKITISEAGSGILGAQEPGWGSAAAAQGQSISTEPETKPAAKLPPSAPTVNSSRIEKILEFTSLNAFLPTSWPLQHLWPQHKGYSG